MVDTESLPKAFVQNGSQHVWMSRHDAQNVTNTSGQYSCPSLVKHVCENVLLCVHKGETGEYPAGANDTR